MRSFILLSLIAAVYGIQIDTVSQLNISQYTGLWYQVYGDRFTQVLEDCYCATAKYGIADNSTLTMATSCHYGAANGTFRSKSGTVHRPDSKIQGKFTMKINGVVNPVEYWVIYLGPATFMDNLYQFSVITDEAQLQLAVLARNVTGFMINYAEKVRMQLQFQGFDKLINKPRVIYQGSDCKYAS
ncbi:uncharacterized protein [Dysidea avara]|uniref:uncharacterized protein n=1 Tax=Dysidea avara TaxID=196820 RepID=UPI00332F8C0C